MNNPYNYNYYGNTPAPVRAKKKSPAVLIAVIAAVLVLALIGGIVASRIFSKPVMKVGKAFETSLKAVKTAELSEFVSTTADGGSVEVTVDGKKLSSSLYGWEVDAGARVKFHFNLNDKSEMGLDAALTLAGSEAVDLRAYTDGKSAAVKSETIFGQKAYGFLFDEVRTKFDSSVFGPDGEYSLGITADELADILDAFSSAGGASGETEDLLKSLGKKLFELLDKYAQTSKTSGSTDAGESTTDVSIALADGDLRSFLLDALRFLRDNEDVRAFLDKIGGTYGSFEIPEPETVLESVEDLIEELEEDEHAADGSSVTGVFRILKKNGQLIETKLDFETGEDRTELSLECAPDWKAPERIVLSVEAPYDSLYVKYTAADGKTAYHGDLRIDYDGDEMFALSVDWDKQGGDLTAAAVREGERVFELKGTLERDGTTTVFKPGSIAFADDLNSFSYDGITVTVRESDPMPVVSDWTDVLTMTEADVEKLTEDVKEFTSDLTSKLVEALGFLAFMFF